VRIANTNINPKTVLNAKFAKKEVKEKVIRSDQLAKYIKEMYEQSKESAVSDEKLLEWAQSYLNFHKEIVKDYTERYEQYKSKTIQPDKSQEVSPAREEKKGTIVDSVVSVEETEIFKELKTYRLSKSRKENIKPYFIYNDNQLKELISKMPRSKEELQSVASFGEAKVNKYGEDILKIVSKY
jgi:superfamily II DNA helicase RecQ